MVHVRGADGFTFYDSNEEKAAVDREYSAEDNRRFYTQYTCADAARKADIESKMTTVRITPQSFHQITCIICTRNFKVVHLKDEFIASRVRARNKKDRVTHLYWSCLIDKEWIEHQF